MTSYLVVGYMYYLLSENKIIISFGRKVYQLLLGNSTIIPNIFLQVKLNVNVKFQNWYICTSVYLWTQIWKTPAFFFENEFLFFLRNDTLTFTFFF